MGLVSLSMYINAIKWNVVLWYLSALTGSVVVNK